MATARTRLPPRAGAFRPSTPDRSKPAARGWVAILSFWFTAGCGVGGGFGGTEADTLYIGVAAARTENARAYFNGVALALEALNAERPGNSPPLGMRLPPAQSATQVEVAAGFRDDPRVVAVVGHTGSGANMEAAPIYGDVDGRGRRALVAVSPTATNPAVTRASSWVFRVCPTDRDAARVLAEYAGDSLRLRQLHVVYRNDLFGRGFLQTFSPVFERLGGEIRERLPYLGGITEYEAYAGLVRRDAVDGVVFAGGSGDALQLVTALRDEGVAPVILGTDDLASLVGNPDARGIRFTSFFLPTRTDSPAARIFVRRYTQEHGTTPDHRAALAFDATMLIGRAVFEVGSNRRRIRDAIAEVGGDRDPHEGITGVIRFDEQGDAIDKALYVGEVGR